jgi:NADH:ubiquinone oxidoreductase subunit F (NADH-binding)
MSMRPARGSAVRAGLRVAADALAAVVDLRARLADIPRLEAILGEVAGRGACHHLDGAIRMIGSLMTAFSADLRAHLVGSGCRHLGDAGFFPAPAEG